MSEGGTPQDDQVATQVDGDEVTEDEDDELFSGAAALATWGRLLNVKDLSAQLVMSGDGVYTVGRADGCSLRLTAARVSSTHARLSRDAVGVPLVEDVSTNGTFVNGAKVGKGSTRMLAHWDEIAFIHPSTASAALLEVSSFIFCAPSCAAPSTAASAAPAASAADSRAATASSGTLDGSRGGSDAPEGAAAAPSDDRKVERELFCSICQDLLHRPVALQPCLHTFCGACFGEWIDRKSVV